MKRKLFKQLWKTLIRDNPKTQKGNGVIVDTCSDNLMNALQEASRDKSICFAEDVRKEASKLSQDERKKMEVRFTKRLGKLPAE